MTVEDWMVELLDELTHPNASHSDVAIALRKRAEEIAPWPVEPLDDEELGRLPESAWVLDALGAAHAYYYREAEHRETASEPFIAGQWKGRTEDPWPPRVTAVAEEMLRLWEEAALRTRQPLAAARLHDLLLLARHGDVFRHIVGAVRAYIQLANACGDGLCAALALARGLEIAVITRQDSLRDEVVARIITAADVSLDGDEHKPGVTLRLLQSLVEAGFATEQTANLLARTRDRYADDVWITEDVIALQRAGAGEDERISLDREAVQSLLDAADQVAGLSRHALLEKAATFARRRKVDDLGDEAIRRMQLMTSDDLGLQVIESSVELSLEERQEIEKWLDRLQQASDPVAALRRLVSGFPPSGNTDQNREQVTEQRQQFVFAALLSPKRIGYGAMPQYEPTTEEERFNLSLAEIEGFMMQMQAPLYARGLKRIGEHFAPQPAELMERLSTLPRMSPGAARSVARALGHYWQGEYEASVMR